MMEHRIFMRKSLTINPLSIRDRYANLSNLSLLERSSRRAIGEALDLQLDASPIEKSSYLILSLSFKEYSHATNLAVRLFGTEEFETISDYYNRLATEYPDRHLLIFAGNEIKPILERVGACIRSIYCGTEGIYRTTLHGDRYFLG
jgi:hypothetical protein